MGLSKLQKKAVGENVPKEIYFDKLDQLYSNPKAEFIEEGDLLQSFDEFVKMGNHEPDEHGNGRNLVTSDRRTIAIITLGTIPHEKSVLSSLNSLLSAYFCLEITQLPPLGLRKISKNWSIIDESNECYYPLIKSSSKLNVFSIFDVLTHYLLPSHCCMICLTSSPLYDPEQPSSFILGRGCGDRLCVVSVTKNRRETFSTVLHECMHTIGIDHCIAWTCIMNSMVNSVFSLCPCDLRKLHHAIGFDIKERLHRLSKAYKKLRWHKEYKECNKYLKLLNITE